MNDCCKGSCQAAGQPAADEPSPAEAQWSSRFHVARMDCPAEERLISLALQQSPGVCGLSFDLQQRELQIRHDGPLEPIAARLAALNLDSTFLDTCIAEPSAAPSAEQTEGEARVLKWLLAINALMFVVEFAAGLLARSAGLIGDSLDMFADAAVYGLALYAVGRSLQLQLRAARLAGVLQMLLALGVLLEVGRRALYGSDPVSLAMILVALLALCANLTCLALLARHRGGGAHMRASWIFSANDVLINAGVIVAGALVAWTGSHYPDLIIGSLIGVLVLYGARRILALRN